MPSASTSTYQPRQRPPRLSGFAGHSPPAGGRQVADWDVPGMEKGALFAHPRVIPILTVPYPGGGRVAKQRFVSKGGWQATNNRLWNAMIRATNYPLTLVPNPNHPVRRFTQKPLPLPHPNPNNCSPPGSKEACKAGRTEGAWADPGGCEGRFQAPWHQRCLGTHAIGVLVE